MRQKITNQNNDHNSEKDLSLFVTCQITATFITLLTYHFALSHTMNDEKNFMIALLMTFIVTFLVAFWGFVLDTKTVATVFIVSFSVSVISVAVFAAVAAKLFMDTNVITIVNTATSSVAGIVAVAAMVMFVTLIDSKIQPHLLLKSRVGISLFAQATSVLAGLWLITRYTSY